MFADENDYKLVSAGDIISTRGLDALLRGDLSSAVTVLVKKAGSDEVIEIPTVHGLSKDQVRFQQSLFRGAGKGTNFSFVSETNQVEWIAAGSALNVIKAKAAAELAEGNDN